MTPEVQVGDWVLIAGGVVTISAPSDFEWISTYRILEIRGLRDGQPWHWTREGGAKP